MRGNVIYPSLEDLKENNPCWETCGVVKCKVTLEEWVLPQEIHRFGVRESITVEELEKNPDLIRLKAAEGRLEYLEKLVNKQKHKVVNLKANLKKEENNVIE
jgi:hypothetical protein